MNYYDLNYPKTKQLSIYKLGLNIFIFLALLCFTASLFLPIFFTSTEDIYGFWVLATGWMGLVFIQLAWYANPLNLLALLLVGDRPRIAFLLSILAIALASCSFVFYEIPTGINYEKVYIREFGLGFYFWYVAHVLVVIGLMIGFIGSLKKIESR